MRRCIFAHIIGTELQVVQRKQKQIMLLFSCATLLSSLTSMSLNKMCMYATPVLAQGFDDNNGRVGAFHFRRRRRRTMQRQAMYLPPAPVTPFRGGLKSIPGDDDTGDYDDTNIESSEDSLEAASSDNIDRDYNKRDDAVVTFSPHSSSTSSLSSRTSAISPWAPEDYPDPWTNPILCGGAASASLLEEQYHDNNGQQQQKPGPYSLTDLSLGKTDQQSKSHIRRPLFCDPDQVLDRETLRGIAIKLRAFAENFSSPEVVSEGVDFASSTSNDQQLLNEALGLLDEKDDQQNQYTEIPQPPNHDKNAQTADEVYQERRLFAHQNHFQHTDLHPIRRLRSSKLFSEKQLYSDSVGGLFSTTHRDKVSNKKDSTLEEQRVEVAIALVQKVRVFAVSLPDFVCLNSISNHLVHSFTFCCKRSICLPS